MNQSNESWCTVLVQDERVRASLKHIGRGKFLIIEDKSGKYTGKVVDASDILNCH